MTVGSNNIFFVSYSGHGLKNSTITGRLNGKKVKVCFLDVSDIQIFHCTRCRGDLNMKANTLILR